MGARAAPGDENSDRHPSMIAHAFVPHLGYDAPMAGKENPNKSTRFNTRVSEDLAQAVWALNPHNKSDALRRVLIAGLVALDSYPTPQKGGMED